MNTTGTSLGNPGRDRRGFFLGTLEEVFPTGSNDVFVVRREGKEVLLPATDEVVARVDLQEKSWSFILWRGCCRKMVFDILTIFPEIFRSPLSESLIKKALDKGILQVRIWNLRDFAEDKHRTTDDYPYGGGAGMVMKADPIFRAVEEIKSKTLGPDSLADPQGERFHQGWPET